jgi:cytochrome P450
MSHQFTRFGDIYRTSLYGTNVYVIRDPALANHVLVENAPNYVKGQFIKRVAFLLGNGLMVSEGELWKRQRRMIQPAFHPKSIGGLTKLIARVNLALLEKWQLAAQRSECINLTRDVSGMALEVVLRSILGDDYEEVGSHFDLLSKEPVRDLAFARAFRALGKVILQLADRRRKVPSATNDILDELLRARDPKSGLIMQDGQIINEILTLIVAGHETTASTLNWTWYLISQHPEVEERLSNEVNNLTTIPELEDLPKFPYTRQIVDESMRLYPAGWLMTRRALGDDRLGDYFVPAGTEIYISPYFIQRHPDVWKEPDRFNPDRFGPENSKARHRLAMIPFSAGPRNCIGALFARVEMQIHLLTIAKHLTLRYVQSRPLELDAGVNLRSKYDFVMHPEVKTIGSR